MININRLLKVTIAWISAVYVICFAGVAFIPGIRPGFMRYALHMNMMGSFANGGFMNVTTVGTFISGLIIWNIAALIGAWLFGTFWNSITN